MPKLPRDISGAELARSLSAYGYKVDRQSGSLVRLTTIWTGNEHHVTIPAHNPLKIGTLSAIIGDIANYLGMSKDDLIRKLFS